MQHHIQPTEDTGKKQTESRGYLYICIHVVRLLEVMLGYFEVNSLKRCSISLRCFGYGPLDICMPILQNRVCIFFLHQLLNSEQRHLSEREEYANNVSSDNVGHLKSSVDYRGPTVQLNSQITSPLWHCTFSRVVVNGRLGG